MTPQQIIQEAFVVKDVKEVARILETFSVEDIVTTIQKSGTQHVAALLRHFTPIIAAGVLRSLPSPLKSQTIRRMTPSDTATLLRHLPHQEQEVMLESLDSWMLEDVRALLQYPIGSAGELMASQDHVLCEDLTVDEAMSQLRTSPPNGSSDLYLISRGGKFVGMLAYPDLIKAEKETRLSSLSTPPATTLEPTEPQRTVMQIAQRTRCQTIPVVDQSGSLLGTIGPESIEKSWKAAIIGLFQTLVGVPNNEPPAPSVFLAIQKRLGWIGVNFFIALLAVLGLSRLDPNIVTSQTAALFLPFLLILPISIASQTFGVVWRGIVLESCSTLEKPKVAFREFRIAFIIGGILGLIGMMATSIWSPVIHVSIALGTALWIATTLAGVCAAVLALGLEQTAAAQIQLSGLLLTFLTYTLGISCYFGLIHYLSTGP